MANKVDVKKTLEYVGGKDNVNSVTHCATRLRIRLKNENIDTLDKIKELNGVLGIQKNPGELQVIIGTTVADTYEAFIKEGNFEKRETPQQNKNIFNVLFEALTGCISPIVYAFIVLGMFKSISAIFGPNLLNLISADSDLYVLLEGIGNAITYFIPFLLAYSCSVKLNANTIISLVLASIMLSPTILDIVNTGQAFKVFGLFPMTLINYSSTFLPIILIVAVQSYVEKLLKKIIPDVLKTILVPTLTVFVMTILGLCLLGPIGQWCGNGLANVVMWLSNHASWLEGMLVCGLYVFMVAFGLGGPVFLATFAVYTQVGFDYLYFPYMVLYGMALVGTDLGYFIKTKNNQEKQTALVALTSQLLGSVSEPSIYGILFRNKQCLIINIIACAISGLYCGITHTAVVGMTFSVPVIGSFLCFTGLTTSNLINGSISVVLAFILALVLTLIFYKDEVSE